MLCKVVCISTCLSSVFSSDQVLVERYQRRHVLLRLLVFAQLTSKLCGLTATCWAVAGPTGDRVETIVSMLVLVSDQY